jgi:hypothetical protein
MSNHSEVSFLHCKSDSIFYLVSNNESMFVLLDRSSYYSIYIHTHTHTHTHIHRQTHTHTLALHKEITKLT